MCDKYHTYYTLIWSSHKNWSGDLWNVCSNVNSNVQFLFTCIFDNVVQQQGVLGEPLHLYGNDVFKLKSATQSVTLCLLKRNKIKTVWTYAGKCSQRGINSVDQTTQLYAGCVTHHRVTCWGFFPLSLNDKLPVPGRMMRSGNLSSAWSWWSPERKAGYCRRCLLPAWSSPPLPHWTISTQPKGRAERRRPSVTSLI